ncbi:MAG: hypothetical protein JWM96_439 [Alphaproteobacteria bacterium]|nr:hypothetical protein [Alphaproteobacteria bacterium]
MAVWLVLLLMLVPMLCSRAMADPIRSVAESEEQQAVPLAVIVTKSFKHPVMVDEQVHSEEESRRIPGGTDIIGEKSFQNIHTATIKEIVDYSPGVLSQPRNGAESARLSIRGSGLTHTFQGSGLLLLQDGVPINTADGGFEFAVIDPWLVQYAQVYRGANALSLGTSTLGGAINFITPTGITALGYGMKAETGSFGDRHTQISTGESIGTSDVFAAATAFSQKGFRSNNEQETYRFSGNAGWQSAQHVMQRLYLSQTDTDAEIPGAISKAEIAADPEQANPNNIRGRFQRNLDISRIAHRLAWEEGPQRLETTVYYTYRHLDNPVTTYIKEANYDSGLRLKFQQKKGLDNWIVGGNLAYGTGDEDRFNNVGGLPGARILNRDLEASTLELYGQYERHLAGPLFGIAAIQASHAERNIEESFPTERIQGQHYTGVNPRLGLRYDLNAVTQIFGNLSRSFEPPTLDELSGGNSPGFGRLKAQRATTAEIGARGMWSAMKWEADYYHSLIDNEFINYRFASGATDTINANRTQHDGIELGIAGDVAHNVFQPNDALQWRNAYTWSRFVLKDDPLYKGNQLPGAPEHFLRSELLYRHLSGISFGPNVEWVPSAYPIDLTNSVETEPYFIYGAMASLQLPRHGVSLYVEGRNLANRPYIATTNVVPDAGGKDGRFFYPGEGRAVYAGFRVGF